MNFYQHNQRRILALIAASRWREFSSEDEPVLKALLVTGYIEFEASVFRDGRTRLLLNNEGWRYLYFLQGVQQPPRSILVNPVATG
jgi:hypothetical protein